MKFIEGRLSLDEEPVDPSHVAAHEAHLLQAEIFRRNLGIEEEPEEVLKVPQGLGQVDGPQAGGELYLFPESECGTDETTFPNVLANLQMMGIKVDQLARDGKKK